MDHRFFQQTSDTTPAHVDLVLKGLGPGTRVLNLFVPSNHMASGARVLTDICTSSPAAAARKRLLYTLLAAAWARGSPFESPETDSSRVAVEHVKDTEGRPIGWLYFFYELDTASASADYRDSDPRRMDTDHYLRKRLLNPSVRNEMFGELLRQPLRAVRKADADEWREHPPMRSEDRLATQKAWFDVLDEYRDNAGAYLRDVTAVFSAELGSSLRAVSYNEPGVFGSDDVAQPSVVFTLSNALHQMADTIGVQRDTRSAWVQSHLQEFRVENRDIGAIFVPRTPSSAWVLPHAYLHPAELGRRVMPLHRPVFDYSDAQAVEWVQQHMRGDYRDVSQRMKLEQEYLTMNAHCIPATPGAYEPCRAGIETWAMQMRAALGETEDDWGSGARGRFPIGLERVMSLLLNPIRSTFGATIPAVADYLARAVNGESGYQSHRYDAPTQSPDEIRDAPRSPLGDVLQTIASVWRAQSSGVNVGAVLTMAAAAFDAARDDPRAVKGVLLRSKVVLYGDASAGKTMALSFVRSLLPEGTAIEVSHESDKAYTNADDNVAEVIVHNELPASKIGVREGASAHQLTPMDCIAIGEGRGLVNNYLNDDKANHVKATGTDRVVTVRRMGEGFTTTTFAKTFFQTVLAAMNGDPVTKMADPAILSRYIVVPARVPDQGGVLRSMVRNKYCMDAWSTITASMTTQLRSLMRWRFSVYTALTIMAASGVCPYFDTQNAASYALCVTRVLKRAGVRGAEDVRNTQKVLSLAQSFSAMAALNAWSSLRDPTRPLSLDELPTIWPYLIVSMESVAVAATASEVFNNRARDEVVRRLRDRFFNGWFQPTSSGGIVGRENTKGDLAVGPYLVSHVVLATGGEQGPGRARGFDEYCVWLGEELARDGCGGVDRNVIYRVIGELRRADTAVRCLGPSNGFAHMPALSKALYEEYGGRLAMLNVSLTQCGTDVVRDALIRSVPRGTRPCTWALPGAVLVDDVRVGGGAEQARGVADAHAMLCDNATEAKESWEAATAELKRHDEAASMLMDHARALKRLDKVKRVVAQESSSGGSSRSEVMARTYRNALRTVRDIEERLNAVCPSVMPNVRPLPEGVGAEREAGEEIRVMGGYDATGAEASAASSAHAAERDAILGRVRKAERDYTDNVSAVEEMERRHPFLASPTACDLYPGVDDDDGDAQGAGGMVLTNEDRLRIGAMLHINPEMINTPGDPARSVLPEAGAVERMHRRCFGWSGDRSRTHPSHPDAHAAIALSLSKYRAVCGVLRDLVRERCDDFRACYRQLVRVLRGLVNVDRVRNSFDTDGQHPLSVRWVAHDIRLYCGFDAPVFSSAAFAIVAATHGDESTRARRFPPRSALVNGVLEIAGIVFGEGVDIPEEWVENSGLVADHLRAKFCGDDHGQESKSVEVDENDGGAVNFASFTESLATTMDYEKEAVLFLRRQVSGHTSSVELEKRGDTRGAHGGSAAMSPLSSSSSSAVALDRALSPEPRARSSVPAFAELAEVCSASEYDDDDDDDAGNEGSRFEAVPTAGYNIHDLTDDDGASGGEENLGAAVDAEHDWESDEEDGEEQDEDEMPNRRKRRVRAICDESESDADDNGEAATTTAVASKRARTI